jgi:hypothetical protein
MKKILKLDDSSIVQIVRLIQMGMLTGTDVSDQLRTLRLTVEKDTDRLVLSQEYAKTFDENLNRLVELAESSTKED